MSPSPLQPRRSATHALRKRCSRPSQLVDFNGCRVFLANLEGGTTLHTAASHHWIRDVVLVQWNAVHVHAAANLRGSRAQHLRVFDGAGAADGSDFEPFAVGHVGSHYTEALCLARVGAATLIDETQALAGALAANHGFLAVDSVPAAAQSVAEVAFRHNSARMIACYQWQSLGILLLSKYSTSTSCVVVRILRRCIFLSGPTDEEPDATVAGARCGIRHVSIF